MNELLDRLDRAVLYAPEQDMWVRFDADGLATVGATHLVAHHGQFMLFSPRPVGMRIARDRSLGVMETAKTAVAVHAPLSCEIVEVNPRETRLTPRVDVSLRGRATDLLPALVRAAFG